MMDLSLAQFDGPRLVRRDELFASLGLFHVCFGGTVVEEEEDIRANYIPPRRGGTYVIVHEGKLVSQIGIFHDQLRMYDATIPTGSIGGVCTHPEYRKQGLASRLLEHCTQQLVKEGARLMLISGDAGVYMRLGNVFQGKYRYFSIGPGQGSGLRPTSSSLVLRKATSADALLCSQLYQAEPVHFVRKKSSFAAALKNPIGNPYLHAEPWIIERGGQGVAYLFLGIPYDKDVSSGVRHVSEYAGSRSALVGALPSLMATGTVTDLSWPVAWQDAESIHLLQENGYAERMASLEGHTLRIIDFRGFMKDLRPILPARLDAALLRGLRFDQSGPLLGGMGEDRYTIVRGKDRLKLSGAEMTCLVMGSADSEPADIPAPGALAEVISALFPLPSFLPGLNYH